MLRAEGFKAVRDGKVQEVWWSQGAMSVTGRDGNCDVSDSFGKAPNALSQSCELSRHLAHWFCSPAPSPGSAVGKPECWTCLSSFSAALSSSCSSLS